MPAAPTTAAEATAGAVKKKILFFSKSSGFEHSVISWKNGQPSWAEKQLSVIGQKNGWEFTFFKDGSLFSPEYLKGFDAVLFYTTGDLTTEGTDKQPPMSAAGKQALLDYVKNGGAFAGTHAAADTFHTDNESKKGPDRYVNHGDKADRYVRLPGAEFIKHGLQLFQNVLTGGLAWTMGLAKAETPPNMKEVAGGAWTNPPYPGDPKPPPKPAGEIR